MFLSQDTLVLRVFWLSTLGANVTGVSLPPSTSPSLFDTLNLSTILSHNIVDVTDYSLFSSLLHDLKPDFIFHLAAQPIVSASYENPLLTWQTNVNGTLNLLESLRTFKHSCIVVCITSDKCYENKEWTWGYRESDQLGGSDPYSVSKAAAELAIQTYARSYFQSSDSCVKVSSARAGNVIGGGDWSNNRIVPDCVKAYPLVSCVSEIPIPPGLATMCIRTTRRLFTPCLFLV